MSFASDMEEIRALHYRYAFATDVGEHQDWVDCFTEDGVFDSPREGVIEGAEALTTFAHAYHERLGSTQQRHVITNILAEVEGDTAMSHSYLLFYFTTDNVTELSAIGVYRDIMRRVDGRWRFARRTVTLDGQPAGGAA